MSKNIYDLDLLEEFVIENNSNYYESIKRVPGGWVWIYKDSRGNTSQFIPYNEEFKEKRTK